MTWLVEAVPPTAAEALAAMHRECFPEEPWDAVFLARLLALPGSFGAVVWQDEAPAGFVLARGVGDEAEILSLGVRPGWRARGAGRALLDAAIAIARSHGAASVVLEVAVDNAAARRLYASAGFAPVGRRPRYYRRAGPSADALILRRGAAPAT